MNLDRKTKTDSRWSTFFLGEEVFALPVDDVQEVLMEQELTPVPLAPSHILGLVNLRGQIIPAIALRRRFRFDEKRPTGNEKLLVIKSTEGLVSVVVDEIGDVLDLPDENWREPPATLSEHHRQYVSAICPIDGHVVLGLNRESLVREDDSSDDSLGADA